MSNNSNSNQNAIVRGDVEIRREGTQIILPEDMSIAEGIDWLKKKAREEETEVAISEIIECHPLEGAHALARALKQIYGWVGLVPVPTFWGPQPPEMIAFEVDFGKTEQVAFGRMNIPGIAGFIQCEIEKKDKRYIFKLGGVVKQKNKLEINKIMNLAREIALKQSIYKGKAIRVNFPAAGKDFSIYNNCPKFLDVSDVKENELIFSKETQSLVQDSIFTLIEKTDMCRKMKIPLKRGNLLEGPYGCGKTLTAYVSAKKCVENGWTFIYLDQVSQLPEALQFAKNYQPAMIFAEDIDRAVQGDTRTQEIDNILNTIDGVDSKNSEIIVVLTTNHVEMINQAMLRPGRLDAVIPVRPPDSYAVQNLIRLYARGLIDEVEDLSKAGQILQGNIPAVIREVVERSKLSAISRLPKGETTFQLTSDDLTRAASGMMQQFELLKTKPQDNRTSVEKAATIIGVAMAKAIKDAAGQHLFNNVPMIEVSAEDTKQLTTGK